MLRILTVAVVLGAEALASVLLDRLKDGVLAFFFIVISIAVLLLIVEVMPEALVKSTDWGARLLGVRLHSGRRVHGYWLTLIRGIPAGKSGQRTDATVLLGGSVLFLRAGHEGFELEGETYMIAQGEWTSWSGTGASLDGNELIFRYGGSEGPSEDDGIGRYTFHTRNIFHGGFYGSGLGKHRSAAFAGEYRSVTGQRLGPEVSTSAGDDKSERRRQLLLAQLHAQAGQP